MTTLAWVKAAVPAGTWVGHWSVDDGHAMRRVRTEVAAEAPGAADPCLTSSPARRIELVFSELVSNALRHGGAPVQVTLFRMDDRWLIDVADGSPTPPAPRVASRFDAGGRGLLIISRLADRCGWTLVDGVKHVWAEVA
ncbi:MAG TPA: ATP-binding protein [Mycobacteriales bacterium]